MSQPQRQTPPVQQPQIPQNIYNGQSPGTMNQHNPYSGGQLPPQGLFRLYRTTNYEVLKKLCVL